MLYLNGEFVSDSQFKLEPSDRGLLLSDGLFETMRVYDGKVFCLKEHYARLLHGAGILKIPVSLKLEQVNEIILKLLKENDLSNKDATLRLTLTRGPGPRGLLPALEPKPTIMITVAPFPSVQHPPLKLHVSNITRRNERSPLSKLKTLGYLDNVLAKMDAIENKADDAIMLNTCDKVTCASAGNVFIVTHYNTIVTPRIEDGILPGITRKIVIDGCKERNIPLIEKELTVDDLMDAKEIFITNSVLEVQPVIMINNQLINDGKAGEITAKIKDIYNGKIKKLYRFYHGKRKKIPQPLAIC